MNFYKYGTGEGRRRSVGLSVQNNEILHADMNGIAYVRYNDKSLLDRSHLV